jgi:hypothetical protein
MFPIVMAVDFGADATGQRGPHRMGSLIRSNWVEVRRVLPVPRLRLTGCHGGDRPPLAGEENQ